MSGRRSLCRVKAFELHLVTAVLALDLHSLRNLFAVSHSSTNPISGSYGPAGRSYRRASAMRGLAVQMQRQHGQRCTRSIHSFFTNAENPSIAIYLFGT